MNSVEDKLQSLVNAAGKKQARYSEIIIACREAIAEIDRLREIEFMYQGLCD